MEQDPREDVSAATVRFERELEGLVVGAFARGVPVERTWEIVTPLVDTPNWSVAIEKNYADGRSASGTNGEE